MGTLSAWSENLSTKKKKKLVDKILSSFNQTLAELTSVNVSSSHNQTGSNDDQLVKSEDCSESRRLRPKDKRGCYKRKRAEEAWTVVSATTKDGHGWRKYGQKEILNSKHPRQSTSHIKGSSLTLAAPTKNRSYFRCTRKYDQGCRATKQVQRLEDDGSQMHRTTYIGTHTCTNRSFKGPRIISNFESRGTCMAPIKQHDDRLSNLAPTTPVIKRETKEEMSGTPSDVTELDSAMWKDLMEFECYSEPDVMISNVYSCTGIKFRNFEMDFVNGFEFDGSDECVL
ncbi:hypothetical protein GOBAR_AA05573 [Gossypium barbadense]|uniref:WRKY domain-containing protein n=1 Tax=Gossypium barbadense TaxID=3634 RepID=A0A2P5YH98_GOSBA|nr:hypothetical protein GOBAR_AA05573 [Gossypium barbadense]